MSGARAWPPAEPQAAALHGGPGAHGVLPHDFSTNANAAGPCPLAWAQVQAADATRYPDPAYPALREALAALHGVAPARVLLAANASEFIQRATAVGAQLAPGPVAVPTPAYGDYARAARAHGRGLLPLGDARATLHWRADPGSPLGQDDAAAAPAARGHTVLDAVYAPLRLSGHSAWTAAALDEITVLHSPNKALGLCGVRGAYAIVPAGAEGQRWAQALQAAQPSWPLGAHAVALLQAWCLPATQAWLQASLQTLRGWKQQQQQALQAAGCTLQHSHTPFFCLRLPAAAQPWCPAQAARHGVQLRDATGLGLPGWWRVNTLAPAAQAALLQVLAARAEAPRAQTAEDPR